MSQDWKKLAQEWADNEIGLVAEVDCTDEGEPLCELNDVEGFPTIKYGDPSALEDYEGGRGFDELSSFAKDNLKPICSPSKLENCDEEKKKEIEALFALSTEEIDAKISGFEKKLQEAESSFLGEVEKLQEKFEQLSKEKERKVAEVKNSGFSLLKSVKAAKAKSDESSSDEL